MDKSLPAGTDPQNTLIVETTPGRIIIKLRDDLAPQHAERDEASGARRLLR